jgi:hypothetical protein
VLRKSRSRELAESLADLPQALAQVADDAAAKDPALDATELVIEEQAVSVECVALLAVLGVRVEPEQLEARVEVVGGVTW